MRRGGIWIALCAMLWACEPEPSFDERYDAAQQEIERKAGEIDGEIAKRARDAVPSESEGIDDQQSRPQANPSD